MRGLFVWGMNYVEKDKLFVKTYYKALRFLWQRSRCLSKIYAFKEVLRTYMD